MASARRTGTNEQVTTYGNCTRTFTSWPAWELATDTDHVMDDESDVLECHDDAASFADHADIDGSTNDATRFRIVRAASGEGHDGTSNNGVFFRETQGADGETNISENFSQIQDLIFSYQSNSAGTQRSLLMVGPDTKAIACIVFDSFNAGSDVAHGLRFQNTSTVVLCLVENSESQNFEAVGTPRIYNCTSVDAGTSNYHNLGATVVAKNCISATPGVTDFETGTYTGSINNAETGTTDPDNGAGNRLSRIFAFVDAAGNDYHLALSDVGARDFGANLSADSDFDFDDDIDGDLFNIWDIGFDEPGFAEADDIPWFMPMGHISE